MNHTNAIFFVLATACLVLICGAFQPALPATLLFSDEFNGTLIDNSKWLIPGIVGPLGEQNCASSLTAGQTVHMTIIASGSSFTYKLGTSLGQRQTRTIDWD